MSFTQVGNILNKDALLFFQHEVMEHSEDTIDYATVIVYAFKQYWRKSGIKELGKKGETAETENLSQLHIRDTLLTESDKHLTKEQKRDALKSLIF